MLTQCSEIAMVPRDRCIENVHAATRIAALSHGELLCVGPDGVRVFGVEGNPLLQTKAERCGTLAPQLKNLLLAAGSWGKSHPAGLTSLVETEWLGEATAELMTDTEGRCFCALIMIFFRRIPRNRKPGDEGCAGGCAWYRWY